MLLYLLKEIEKCLIEVKKFKMDYIITRSDGSEALYHHGIKGQKWGVRKYQNPDGTYTDAGLKRYFGSNRRSERINSKQSKIDSKIKSNEKRLKESHKEWDEIYSHKNNKVKKTSGWLLTADDKRAKRAKYLKNKEKKIRDKTLDTSATNIKNNKLRYKKAKLEAKKNKDYKNSKEYQKIKDAYTHDVHNKLIYGRRGAIKAGAMEMAGYTKIGTALMRNNVNKLNKGANYNKLAKKYG